MKCIRAVKQTKTYNLGEIRRTDNIDADEKVKSGVWMFIPKSEWKIATRKPVKQEVVEVVTEELSIEEKKLARKKNKK